MRSNWKLFKTLSTLFTIVLIGYRVYKWLKQTGIITELQTINSKLQNVAGDIESSVEQIKSQSQVQIIAAKARKQPVKLKVKAVDISPRGKLVKDFIKTRKHISMSEIRDKFPSVTARTLRRDLDKLEQLGMIEQQGKTRGSVYYFLHD